MNIEDFKKLMEELHSLRNKDESLITAKPTKLLLINPTEKEISDASFLIQLNY